MRADADAGGRQPRIGRRQRRPLPARRRWLRRQRHAIRAQEPELPVGGVRCHLKALLVHRAMVEATQQQQIAQPRIAAVGPVHHVVGVAVAGVAAGELALAIIALVQGATQSGGDRTRPATDVENIAVGAVAQRHQARIAGDAARRRRAQMEPAGLLDDRLTGIQLRCLSRRCAAAFAHLARFRGNVRRATARRTGATGSRRPDRVPTTGLSVAHLARFRGNVRRTTARRTGDIGSRRP